MLKLRLLASAAVAAALAPTSAWAQSTAISDESSATEAIVVTGSLLRRSDYQASSPVDTVTRDTLEAKAPNNVAEFVRDIPGNFGSAFSSGRAFGNERGGGTINLRGLGASATLVLINSRRQTQLPDAQDNVVDVNSLVPEIMLERLEILKDGASALYGSDAVAGVVNFITRDNFSGVKLETRVNEFTHNGATDWRVEGMIGTGLGDRFNAVLGFGYYNQEAMQGFAGTIPSQSADEANNLRWTSPSSFPGEFTVPVRDTAGAIIRQQANVVDPTCGEVKGTFPTTTVAGAAVLAPSAAAATDCRYNFFNDNSAQSEIERYSTMLRLNGDLTDGIRMELEAAYSHSRSATAYTVGDPLGLGVVVPGTNPGNIYYRAKDANGNPLYAVSSGIAAGFERDGAQVFLPVRNAAGQVVLTSDPTNAASGIPFYEDVLFNGRGPMGSQCNLPTNNSIDLGACAHSRPSVATNDIFRAAVGFSGDVSSNWGWQIGSSYSRYDMKTNGTTGVSLVNELGYALRGLGGPNCNRSAATTLPGVNGCEYFNIFGNSTFAAPGTPQANSQSVIDYIMPMLEDGYTSSLFTADAVVSGDLFDLPAGSVAVAAGYQYRRSSLEIDYDTQANLGNKANGVTQRDMKAARANHAVFAEVAVPLVESNFGYLEFSGALRHEWIGKSLQTTNPKLGLLFNTNDRALTLRASYGTSFIAPSLYRLFADSASGAAVNDCPVTMGDPCRGDLNLRIAALQKGNLNLKPERSTSYSMGATLRPADGLTFDATWWKFDFSDKIVTPSATSIVAQYPMGTPETPIVRDSSGRILSITTIFTNAASVVTEGLDFSADYRHDLGDLGNVSLNLAGTYMYRYDYQAVAGGVVYDGAGFTNDNQVPPPNSKLRVNGRITWQKGDGTLNVMMRYYGPVTFSRNLDYKLKAWTPIDVSYSHRFDLGGSDLALGVGATNLFQVNEPYVPAPGFQPFVPGLYDVRGRSVYVKAGIEF